VTADLYKPHAQKCLSLLKKHTSRFDLVVLDNNGSKDFNHPREMNKAIRTAKTDFLVLMDDDVLVEEGWLDGLLESVDSETAVVSPLHKDKDGNISHSGVYLLGDEWGTHAHLVDVPGEPRVVQCLCSACLLIDLRKTRGIFFTERYSKYFHDLDHSLQVWEAGYKVVCTPRSIVTHLAGATMPHGSVNSTLLWNRDIQIFAADWVQSGRLDRLRSGMFSRFPFLLLLNYIPRRIRSILEKDSWEFSIFAAEVQELESICARLPLFQSLLVQGTTNCLARCRKRGDNLKAKFCEDVIDRLKDVPVRSSGPVPVLLESYKGYNLVQYLDDVLIVSQSLGPLNLGTQHERERVGILSATGLEAARSSVEEIIDHKGAGPRSSAPLPVLLESYKGYNLVHYLDDILAVPISLGPVNLANRRDRERPGILSTTSIEVAKSSVDAVVGRTVESSLNVNTPLLLETYRYHNLVRFNGQICAVPLSLGPIDLTQDTLGSNPKILTADNVEDTKLILDRIQGPGPTLTPSPSRFHAERTEPTLVLEGYKSFNIVLYGHKYYGILQADGSFDPVRITANGYTCIFAGDTLGELKSRIDRISLMWRVGFRLKPVLIRHPAVWRTAQKLRHTLTAGGGA
jgi:GT2 family glycosyltransferase